MYVLKPHLQTCEGAPTRVPVSDRYRRSHLSVTTLRYEPQLKQSLRLPRLLNGLAKFG